MLMGVRSLRAALAMALLVLATAPSAARAAEEPLPRGTLVERVACQGDPSKTYSLYLPSAYASDRRWPLLLVFDPRGRGPVAAEVFRDAAERFGWIVMSSNDTQSDTEIDPTLRAVQAMWAEFQDRFSVDARRIYAAGFSGTATVAWELGSVTGELAGVVAVGSPLVPDLHDRRVSFAAFTAAGREDFNYRQVKAIDALLAKHESVRRFEVFDGEHEWMPASLAGEALAWFEVVAMREKRRPLDTAWLETQLVAGLRSAEQLEGAGRLVEAQRRLEMLTRGFDGLVDVAPVASRLATLGKRRELSRARRDEQRADEWEVRTIESLRRPLTEIVESEAPMMLAAGENRLRLRSLESQARKDTFEGFAARRVLKWLFVQTSFYIWRDLMTEGSFRRAAYLQQLAVRINAAEPLVWVRLAVSWARADDRDRALKSLEIAVERGLTAVEIFDSVEAFEPLRDDETFVRLRATVAARDTGQRR